MRTHSLCLSLMMGCTVAGGTVGGATTSVHWHNNRSFLDSQSARLDSGEVGISDGALLQLGYYSHATLASPFVGEWIVMASATIGDSHVDVDGYFDTTTEFTELSPNQPPAGTPLSIRFYDSDSLQEARHYNAVSNVSGSWNWQPPTDPGSVLDLAAIKPTASLPDSLGLRFEYGVQDWRTRIAIPEPLAVSMVALAGLWTARRRARE